MSLLSCVGTLEGALRVGVGVEAGGDWDSECSPGGKDTREAKGEDWDEA